MLQINPDPEFQAVGDAVSGLIADIKAGKTVLQDLSDAVGALVGALGSLQNIAADAKKVDNQIYLAYSLAKAFEG